MHTNKRVVGLLVYICRVAIPPCHAAGVGAETALFLPSILCVNWFPAGGACVFLLFQRMSVNIRADRGEGKLKLFSDGVRMTRPLSVILSSACFHRAYA